MTDVPPGDQTPRDPFRPEVPPTEPMPVLPPSDGPPVAVPTGHGPEPVGTTDAHVVATGPGYVPQPLPPWYEDRAAVAAVVIVGLSLLFLLIAWLFWWGSGDDNDTLVATSDPDDSALVVTLPSTTVEVPATTEVTGDSIVVTLPTTIPLTVAPTTVAPTTVPATTTTIPPTTTTTAPTTTPTTTTPPTTTTVPPTTSVPAVTVPPGGATTVLDIVNASPDLSRLANLIVASGLGDQLAGMENITLLAPSDEAIDLLLASPGGQELVDDPARLQALLLRHVIDQPLTADELFALDTVTTLSGDVLVIDPEATTIDGAMLPVVDVTADNGILHVVDTVLVGDV
jgi:uncharacterized surface protein with fasciclin (FAS1) repeats